MRKKQNFVRAALLFVSTGLGIALDVQSVSAASNKIPVYDFQVIHRYPHDKSAYTEGFFYEDGHFYESTGGIGASSIRKIELNSGKILREAPLSNLYYGEGIVSWKKRIIQLTWQNQVEITYDQTSFKQIGKFSYPGEGWALTKDSQHLYMSDGTANLRVLNPDTFAIESIIHVTENNSPVLNLNEIEWVKGEIYANIWLTNRIARIDPKTGHVIGWIDLTGLFDNRNLPDPGNDVLNGIAYDPKGDRLFVTGKCWPFVYEIKLVHKGRGV